MTCIRMGVCLRWRLCQRSRCRKGGAGNIARLRRGITHFAQHVQSTTVQPNLLIQGASFGRHIVRLCKLQVSRHKQVSISHHSTMQHAPRNNASGPVITAYSRCTRSDAMFSLDLLTSMDITTLGIISCNILVNVGYNTNMQTHPHKTYLIRLADYLEVGVQQEPNDSDLELLLRRRLEVCWCDKRG